MVHTEETMDFNRRLGNALQDMRRNKKISQSEIAKMIGLSQTGISNMECGEVAIPAFVVHYYLKTCGADPAALYDLLEGKK